VGPRAGLDTEVRGKILCPCRGSNPDRPVVQPVVSIHVKNTSYLTTVRLTCSGLALSTLTNTGGPIETVGWLTLASTCAGFCYILYPRPDDFRKLRKYCGSRFILRISTGNIVIKPKFLMHHSLLAWRLEASQHSLKHMGEDRL
jgi:hypothetical protein